MDRVSPASRVLARSGDAGGRRDAGKVRAELKGIGVPTRGSGGQFDPAAVDLDVTDRWGIAGKGGICLAVMQQP